MSPPILSPHSPFQSSPHHPLLKVLQFKATATNLLIFPRLLPVWDERFRRLSPISSCPESIVPYLPCLHICLLCVLPSRCFLIMKTVFSTSGSFDMSSCLRCSSRFTPFAHLTTLTTVVATSLSSLVDSGHLSQAVVEQDINRFYHLLITYHFIEFPFARTHL